jgi:hypothetical protein
MMSGGNFPPERFTMQNEEDFFDGEYHNTAEEADAEIAEAKAIVDKWFPKEFVAMLDPVKYARVYNSIKTIIALINASTDEESRPTYKVDPAIIGTSIRFQIQLNEYDITVDSNVLKAMVSSLPADAEITLLPQKGYKTSIFIYYPNVRVILPEK